QPMTRFAPNGYGLYAVNGCVWEWVRDWYDRDYYRQSPERNPEGPAQGQEKVLRGGSWADCAEVVTVSFRMAYATATKAGERGGKGVKAGPGTSVSACVGRWRPADLSPRSRFLLDVPAELEAHRRQQLVRKVRLAAGGEALEKRRGQNVSRHRLFDGGQYRP